MFNFIDLIGIIIVLVCALISFKKGFVRTFFGFISTFLALILAFLLCNVGEDFIKNNSQMDEWLNESLTNSLNYEKNEENEEIEENTSEEDNTLSEMFKNLPQNIKSIVGLEEYKEETKATIVKSSTEIILKIFSWIIIYLLVKIILMILCVVFNGIMSIPLLKQVNNLAGLALGIILGLFRIYVILAFISFLVTFIPSIEPLVDIIKSSLLIRVMYENNILISLIF